MPQSSIGFHTLTMSMPLFDNERNRLMLDFKRYSQKTGDLQIYSDKCGNLVIKFYKEDKGIKWRIRSGVWFERFRLRLDVIDVTINPKILSNICDYITATNCNDMDVAIFKFNRISKEISPVLRTFENYGFRRIDYCINFLVDELAPKCTSELIMDLIRRGDIPRFYREWMQYDKRSHRLKASPDSFYLMSRIAHINCYRKSVDLQNRRNKGITSITQAIVDEAQGIIRFEVQCKFPKICSLARRIGKDRSSSFNKCQELLGYHACLEQINHYYKVTIGAGDWFSLSMAQRIIRGYRFHKQKTERLLRSLIF